MQFSFEKIQKFIFLSIKMSDPELLRRRIIESIVSNICWNAGFVKTEAFALETLCEMFINCKI